NLRVSFRGPPQLSARTWRKRGGPARRHGLPRRAAPVWYGFPYLYSGFGGESYLRLGGASCAEHRTAEPLKQATEFGVLDGFAAGGERCLLGGVERSRRRRRGRLGGGRRALQNGEAGDRAIAEEAVDPLQDARLRMLDLDGRRRGDAEAERAVAPLAAGKD